MKNTERTRKHKHFPAYDKITEHSSVHEPPHSRLSTTLLRKLTSTFQACICHTKEFYGRMVGNVHVTSNKSPS